MTSPGVGLERDAFESVLERATRAGSAPVWSPMRRWSIRPARCEPRNSWRHPLVDIVVTAERRRSACRGTARVLVPVAVVLVPDPRAAATGTLGVELGVVVVHLVAEQLRGRADQAGRSRASAPKASSPGSFHRASSTAPPSRRHDRTYAAAGPRRSPARRQRSHLSGREERPLQHEAVGGERLQIGRVSGAVIGKSRSFGPQPRIPQARGNMDPGVNHLDDPAESLDPGRHVAIIGRSTMNAAVLDRAQPGARRAGC